MARLTLAVFGYQLHVELGEDQDEEFVDNTGADIEFGFASAPVEDDVAMPVCRCRGTRKRR